MYSNKVASEIKKIAENAMDSTQKKIGEINTLGEKERSKSEKNILNWQTWIGTISFSLAAIGSALIVSGQLIEVSALISLSIFFILGLWIALEHKRMFEHKAATASKDIDELRPLYDDKKKIAFKLWESPRSEKNHLAFLGQEHKIMQRTIKLEKELLNQLESQKVSYSNDIILALFILAIYLLMTPMFNDFANMASLSDSTFYLSYVLIGALLFAIICYEAKRSATDILMGTESKKQKIRSELKHSEEYAKEINRRIELLKHTIRSS